ncbi:MAG: cytochrome d ubiquinol oxidase subunit II [Pseudomonadota bacterium]
MEHFASFGWLPLIFAGLMGLAMLIYVILDGYDLGVGILMSLATEHEKDTMIASIGPFWDANETWLVLGIGILLVAFPQAHGIILTSLYIPVAIMLAGLIMRGVSFDFRAKAKSDHKHLWDKVFIIGSVVASVAQGFMLAQYILGFSYTFYSILFSLLAGLFLASGYGLMGATWLIMKTQDNLQKKAVLWARYALWFTALGMVMVSITTPLMSDRIFNKWFSIPEIFLLLPIPMITAALIIAIDIILRKIPRPADTYCWVPFVGSAALFVLGFDGLAYSFYPYIVPDQLTIWQAASDTEALEIILVGVAIVLPCIIGYTIFSYYIFRGKSKELTYY